MSRWEQLSADARDYLCWWIEELEAPPREAFFKQGKGTLVVNQRHCCLGVYCEVHPDVTSDGGIGFLDLRADHINSKQMTGTLNQRLMIELDLTRNEQNDLIRMNDGGDERVDFANRRRSFAEIAQELRHYYEVPEWV